MVWEDQKVQQIETVNNKDIVILSQFQGNLAMKLLKRGSVFVLFLFSFLFSGHGGRFRSKENRVGGDGSFEHLYGFIQCKRPSGAHS